VAVVEVVLARRESGKWPNTAFKVISQRAQFSFVRRGVIPPVRSGAYERHRDLVLQVLRGELSSSARGATFFHAVYARPSWRHSMRQISKIGRHLFYVS
jgi:spore germination cell wall hydrolase CwlJ-like protein